MKFSISSSVLSSEADSLSMSSRYRATSDTSLLDIKMDGPSSFATKIGEKGGRPSALPQPIVQDPQSASDISAMFTPHDYQPSSTSTVLTVVGMTMGVALGVLLVELDAQKDVINWVSLLGKLYLDALLCLVLPMVFCTVIIAVAELMEGKLVQSITIRTMVWFTITALLSSTIGAMFGALFGSMFTTEAPLGSVGKIVSLALKCPSGKYLTQSMDATLACTTDTMPPSWSKNLLLTLNETDPTFARTGFNLSKLTLADQAFSILFGFFPANIMGAFAQGSSVSIVSFAFIFAIACVQGHDSSSNTPNYLLLITKQASLLFRMMINLLLKFLPVGVISLLAGAIATQDQSLAILDNVLYLILALSAGLVTMILVAMGVILKATTGSNIVTFFKHLLPVQAFVLGCPSSIAALPLTIRCVDATGEVSPALSRVVLPLGAIANKSGTAMYIPLACVFLAKASGNGDKLTASTYIFLILASSLGSFGAAPVPRSGLVMVLTVWFSVLGLETVPQFTVLVAADWILDRLRTFGNVAVHAILARILSGRAPVSHHANEKNPMFLYEDSLGTPISTKEEEELKNMIR